MELFYHDIFELIKLYYISLLAVTRPLSELYMLTLPPNQKEDYYSERKYEHS